MKRLFIIALLASSIVPTKAAEIDLSKPSSKLRRFMGDVIFVVEAGDRERHSKRLRPKIQATFQCTAAERKLVETKLAAFNELTGLEVTSVEKPGESAAAIAPVETTDDNTAKVTFYFGESAALVDIAKKVSPQVTLNQGSNYWTWWDEKRMIKSAVVFICRDKLAGNEMEARLVEMLLGVYGLPARSGETDDSCLSDRTHEFTSLQPIDKAVLKFYYKAVPADTKPAELDKIFREQWGK